MILVGRGSLIIYPRWAQDTQKNNKKKRNDTHARAANWWPGSSVKVEHASGKGSGSIKVSTYAIKLASEESCGR